MAKVYVKKYTNNGTPKALPAIVVGVGNLLSTAVGFPSEGYLTRLVVKQTGGTDVAFDVDLLDSKIPYPPSEVPVATLPADNIQLYQIIPTQNVGVPGNALELMSPNNGYPFHNSDGTYTNNQRVLYLVIKPIGAVDDTTWDVSLTAHTDIS
jgi:hypothetical protein